MQKRTTLIENSILLIEKPVLIRFFKDYWCTKLITMIFGTTLLRIKLLKVRNPTPNTRIYNL